MSRDLAIVATRQAKQQTTTALQQKTILEADISDLQARADSYPTDMQMRLDALSTAANEYRNAAAVNEGGPLITFLKKIKVSRTKKDGSTAKISVYDLWGEYRQKQEQQLNTKAVQARQQATEVQRQLPSFQSTAAQCGNLYGKDF